MISLPHMLAYFSEQIKDSDGLLRNIFLTNCDSTPRLHVDEVIATALPRYEEASILSTLFNDSLYTIHINLYEEKGPPENEAPLEIVAKVGDGVVFLYGVQDQFILGVEADPSREGHAHKTASLIVRHVTEQLGNVVKWMKEDGGL